jgi:hypothetical protein
MNARLIAQKPMLKSLSLSLPLRLVRTREERCRVWGRSSRMGPFQGAATEALGQGALFRTVTH